FVLPERELSIYTRKTKMNCLRRSKSSTVLWKTVSQEIFLPASRSRTRRPLALFGIFYHQASISKFFGVMQRQSDSLTRSLEVHYANVLSIASKAPTSSIRWTI